jgi:hypothetical protein
MGRVSQPPRRLPAIGGRELRAAFFMGMLQEGTRLRDIERHQPDVQVSIIGGLRAVRNESPVGGPIRREFRTFRVKHGLFRSAAQRLAEEAHPAVIAPPKDNFVAVRGPDGIEVGLGHVRVSETEDSSLA